MAFLARKTSVIYWKSINYFREKTLGGIHNFGVHVKRWKCMSNTTSLLDQTDFGNCKKFSTDRKHLFINSDSCKMCNVHGSSTFLLNHTLVHGRLVRLHSTHSENVFSLQNVKLKAYIDSLAEKYESAQRIISEGESQVTDSSVHKLRPLIAKYKEYLEQQENEKELHSIILENVDQDMTEMAREDLQQISENLSRLEAEIVRLVMPVETIDESDVILEVNPGVGGQESMLFAKEIFQMYSRYAASRGWQFDVISADGTDQGGLRKASASVGGRGVYQYLKYEGGVHRVQRVPKTERSGRIHTSTVTVVTMPLPTEIEIELNPRDLKITTVRSSGAGGQHVNKTESSVRIVHIPTGTVAECEIDRSQFKNKSMAMKILRSKLYEAELEKIKKKEVTQRKLQVGSSGRSEKIRTYNFPQDRVTDHRVGISLHHIQSVMGGGEELHELMESLQGEGKRESLLELLGQFEKEQKTGQK